MNRRRVHLFSLAALLLSVLGSAGFAGYTLIAQETKPPQSFAGDSLLKTLADYKEWTRVNDVPLPVSFSLANATVLTGANRFTGV